LVGAGGKTSALFQAACDYLKTGQTSTILLTTTTHLAQDQVRQADHHFIIHHPDQLAALDNELPAGVVLVTGQPSTEADQPARLIGLDQACMLRLLALANAHQAPLLIEADGSRRLPLKAPAEHEPAIPIFANIVAVVAGLSGLGKPLTNEWVHRPERFAELAGQALEQPITPQALVRVLAHPLGGIKNIPPNSRRVLLLNQAATPDLQALAYSITPELLQSFHAVIIANLPENGAQPGKSEGESSATVQPSAIFAVHEPVAGIILAAGEASRFGQPKQLLLWQNEPLVHHCARIALQAGLSPVIAVTGESSPQISHALADLDVRVVHNPDWQQGQSTSVQAGLQALPDEIGATIFLLSDQPQVHVELLQALVENHAASLAPIVAPLVDGQRANPVLFDCQTFPELMKISGDTGGRELFSRYSIRWVVWHDRAILLDIDTPEDYQRLLEGPD